MSSGPAEPATAVIHGSCKEMATLVLDPSEASKGDLGAIAVIWRFLWTVTLINLMRPEK
jgi:hypothetical protein